MSFSYVWSKQLHSVVNIGSFKPKHMAQRDQQGEIRNNTFANQVSKVAL